MGCDMKLEPNCVYKQKWDTPWILQLSKPYIIIVTKNIHGRELTQLRDHKTKKLINHEPNSYKECILVQTDSLCLPFIGYFWARSSSKWYLLSMGYAVAIF